MRRRLCWFSLPLLVFPLVFLLFFLPPLLRRRLWSFWWLSWRITGLGPSLLRRTRWWWRLLLRRHWFLRRHRLRSIRWGGPWRGIRVRVRIRLGCRLSMRVGCRRRMIRSGRLGHHHTRIIHRTWLRSGRHCGFPFVDGRPELGLGGGSLLLLLLRGSGRSMGHLGPRPVAWPSAGQRCRALPPL